MLEACGKDATKLFFSLHRRSVLDTRLGKLKVGEMMMPAPARNAYDPHRDLCPIPFTEIDMEASPSCYDASHKRLRLAIRAFLVDSGFKEYANQIEDGAIACDFASPQRRALMKAIARAGLFALCSGPANVARIIASDAAFFEGNLFQKCGIPYDKIDYFHCMVFSSETGRLCAQGTVEGFFAGPTIAMNPLLKYGSPRVFEEVVMPVMRGERTLCLAVTEPERGSDVAGVSTRAEYHDGTVEEGEGGPHYRITGSKKFITNSVFADFFTALVRVTKSNTNNHQGLLTMMLVARQPAISVRPMKTTWGEGCGTGLVVFEGARVPAGGDYLLGKEGEGLKITLQNFSFERLVIVSGVLAHARTALRETISWCFQREAFGKRLADQPVVRNALGRMITEVAAVSALFEQTVQSFERGEEVGGRTGFLKYAATRMSHNVVDGCVQLFGGRACAEEGMGVLVARFARYYKVLCVGEWRWRRARGERTDERAISCIFSCRATRWRDRGRDVGSGGEGDPDEEVCGMGGGGEVVNVRVLYG